MFVGSRKPMENPFSCLLTTLSLRVRKVPGRAQENGVHIEREAMNTHCTVSKWRKWRLC